jgi:hypothetical protein
LAATPTLLPGNWEKGTIRKTHIEVSFEKYLHQIVDKILEIRILPVLANNEILLNSQAVITSEAQSVF